MNYITLNGVKSNTIKGLMIQSLPSISKPLVRTTIEEIDGRDGDITTKLGYSAYDKTMIIGLYGNYNVDDVIQYFDSSGTVVFSNEPDKYYNYEIIQQIDFERLLRFKTATVTFHVQPFKYSDVEKEQTFNTDTTGNGQYLVLSPTLKDTLNYINLEGNTVQNGTPTPDDPVTIQTVTGTNNINISGKNLFNISNLKAGGLGTPTLTTRVNFMSTGIFPIGTKVTVTRFNTALKMGIAITNSSGTIISNNSGWRNTNQLSFTSTAEGYIGVNIAYLADTTITTSNISASDFQIEIGDGTSYVAYQGKTLPISLGDIELCKIGDYQDYIYQVGTNWYLHKEIGKLVLDGTQTFKMSGTSTGNTNYTYFYSSVLDSLAMSGITNDNCYCDRFNVLEGNMLVNTNVSTDTINVYRLNNANMLRLMILTSRLSTQSVAALNTFFKENNTTLYYVLATATDTQITDTTLLSQLNNLVSASSYDNITVISSNYSDGNAQLIIDASVSQTKTINVRNIGNIYSRPIMALYGNGTINLYVNGIQTFVINLTDQITIDSNKMNAYNGNTLMNRNVIGDYDSFILGVGLNTISWTGNVTKIELENYSRWI